MLNRRNVLQAGAAGLALSLSSRAYAAPQEKAKRVGLIGCGWYGKVDLFRLVQVAPVEIVSLCDVDSKMLSDCADMAASRQKSGKRPRTYADYREMLAEKDLDIVLIGTPDHWHALPMIEAVKAGADIYVQKPISVDVVEGQAMLAAARKYNRVVQVGTQRRSTPHLIDAMNEVVKTGMLGKVAHAEVYCYYHMRARENAPDIAPPDHLDYEMWAGPAPKIPYNNLIHPRRWRAFMEYGNGIMGDMCIHMLDTVRWMLDLGWPKTVTSAGGILVDKNSRANISDTQSALFDFGDMTVSWQHRTWGTSADPEYPWGATIYGDKGTLKLSVNRFDFIPQGSGKPLHGEVKMELDEYPEDRDEKDLERHVAPAVRGHMRDLLKCIEDRSRPVADIEEGYISTTSCILANLSMQLGRTLAFDPTTGKVINDDEANSLLARPYREPWVHPTPDSV